MSRSSTTGSGCTRPWAIGPRPRPGPPWKESACVQPRDVLIPSLHSSGGSPGGMPRRPGAQARSMLERVARAIAEADGGDFDAEPARYRRLAVAALGPLAHPTAAMIDAAHGAVWFDAGWAIDNASDFRKAARAMIEAGLHEQEGKGSEGSVL